MRGPHLAILLLQAAAAFRPPTRLPTTSTQTTHLCTNQPNSDSLLAKHLKLRLTKTQTTTHHEIPNFSIASNVNTGRFTPFLSTGAMAAMANA